MNYALGHSLRCESATAAKSYERAEDAYLHAWPGVGPAVDEALAAALEFALAYALRALRAAASTRRAKVAPAIETAHRWAIAASERERSHLVVLADLLQGRAEHTHYGAEANVERWPKFGSSCIAAQRKVCLNCSFRLIARIEFGVVLEVKPISATAGRQISICHAVGTEVSPACGHNASTPPSAKNFGLVRFLDHKHDTGSVGGHSLSFSAFRIMNDSRLCVADRADPEQPPI
jgi:hypothetical protein